MAFDNEGGYSVKHQNEKFKLGEKPKQSSGLTEEEQEME